MPLYRGVNPPVPRPPRTGLLQAARVLGFLSGQMASTEGPAPTEPPSQGEREGSWVPDQNITANENTWHEVGGVSWLPFPCAGGGTYDPCAPAATPLIDASEFPEGVQSAGFPVKYGVECTATDPYTREQSAIYATRMLDVRQHYIIGREFWRGEQATESGWPNVYLTDASTTQTIGVGLSTCGALALLEEAIAGNAISGSDLVCSGAQGYIHASPALATAWARDYNVVWEGGVLVTTSTRTPVISGPGYDGTGPGYPSPEEQGEGESWAYATGPFDVRLSPTQTIARRDSINKATNVYTQWAERAANVATDACCITAVQVDLGSCSTESGTG